MFQLPRKTEVAKIYLDLLEAHYQFCLTVNKTAVNSRVSWGLANMAINKLKALGAIEDPEVLQQKKDNVVGPGQKLTTIHEMFLLGRWTINPTHPLYSYVQELNSHIGLLVSYQSISDWFEKCWDFNGSLRQANIVPLNKWKATNKLRYYEFIQKLHVYSDHSKYNFNDEKHIYNKDVYTTKLRADPLDGNCPASTSAATSGRRTT
jgi:hypothetical protein